MLLRCTGHRQEGAFMSYAAAVFKSAMPSRRVQLASLTAVLACTVAVAACGKDSGAAGPTTAAPAGTMVSASDALSAAQKVMPAGDWSLATISNSGVMQSTIGFSSGAPTLLGPDGSAAKWVVEFVQPAAANPSPDGGFQTPYSQVVVSNGQAAQPFNHPIHTPSPVTLLDPGALAATPNAEHAALAAYGKDKYAAISVASFTHPDAPLQWVVRIYPDPNPSAPFLKALVSADGSRVDSIGPVTGH